MKFLELKLGEWEDISLEYSNKYLKFWDTVSNYWSVIQVVSEVPKHINERLLDYIDVWIISNKLLPTWNWLYQASDNSYFLELRSKDTWKIQLWKVRSINFWMDPSKMRLCNLDIVVLICLFNANGIVAISNDWYKVPFNQMKNISGKWFSSFEIQETLTHYELESIQRLTWWIKEMMKEGTCPYSQVRLNLPITAYFIYWLEEFLKWSIYRETLLILFWKIKERGEKILQSFVKRLPIPVVFDDPLSLIQDYIITSLRNGDKPKLEDVLEILGWDTLWKIILWYRKPKDWNELASDISEVVSEIQYSYNFEGSPSILLKNPKEEWTLNLTKKVARQIERVTGIPMGIIWIYSYEQIYIDNSVPVLKRRMYDVSWIPTIKHAKTITQHY